MRNSPKTSRPQPFDPDRLLRFPVPAPVPPSAEADAPPGSRRTRLWELGDTLHCSIIGTCLSTAELRRALGKANLESLAESEHRLHGQGVALAGKPGHAAKLLHKALDERHRLMIRRFERAGSEAEVRALWREARARGEIPGAYWAVLTHPATTAQLVRDVFGEVHMLSHLVGAANRADIRRLAELEAEKAALEDKVERQQRQLQAAVGSRDARIRDLNGLLARRLAEGHEALPAPDDAALGALVADLQRRLAREQGRSAALEQRLGDAQAALVEERSRREQAERLGRQLRDELEALEASLVAAPDPDEAASVATAGLSVLYVGGHPGLVPHLRAASRRLGIDFAHHDGGVDERPGLLAGLVSRAGLVLFPVDCISHDAALGVKRLCRQAEKPFVPLRSAGLAAFVAALSRAGDAAPPAS